MQALDQRRAAPFLDNLQVTMWLAVHDLHAWC